MADDDDDDDEAGIPVETNVPLAPLTTLELGGQARYLIEAHDDATAIRAIAWADARRLPVAILGGGSNVVVSDAGFDGVVVKMRTRGVQFHEGGIAIAAAGEPWDDFVAATVARGWAGVECLTGIPGLVGGTPIQNVGAYGQEVAQTIREVRALERRSGRVVTLPREACGFGYRDSAFRRDGAAYVVLAVTFALRPGGTPTIAYRELEDALVARSSRASTVTTPPTTASSPSLAAASPSLVAAAPSLADVAAVVRELRRRKSMIIDPGDPNRRSVGSFFTNPVLDAAAFAAFTARAIATGVVGEADEIPSFAAEAGHRKVPAAWLIERSGYAKGFRRGAVGISTAHALALVHHGGGTTRELIALGDEIRDAVHARFGVTLGREPIFIGPAASVG